MVSPSRSPLPNEDTPGRISSGRGFSRRVFHGGISAFTVRSHPLEALANNPPVLSISVDATLDAHQIASPGTFLPSEQVVRDSVIGTNALAAYLSSSVARLGQITDIFTRAGAPYLGDADALVHAMLLLAVEWAILYRLYRRRIFLSA